jgi:hypothetical protein
MVEMIGTESVSWWMESDFQKSSSYSWEVNRTLIELKQSAPAAKTKAKKGIKESTEPTVRKNALGAVY